VVDTPLEPAADDVPRPGASLTTSGAELSLFPDSIPVGKVRSVREAGGGLALDLIVRPMVDTTRLGYVTVLLWPAP
jgi:cell shape-determining protein MreC